MLARASSLHGVRHRRVAVLFAVAVTTVLVVGCGDPATKGSTASTAATTGNAVAGAASVEVDPDGVLAPGTPMTSALSVRDGSRLVGRVFPWIPTGSLDPSATATQPGWQALLVVDGDPIKVWDGYATALGIGDIAGAVQSCTVEALAPSSASGGGSTTTVTTTVTTSATPSPTRSTRFLTELRIDGENRLSCAARSDGVDMSMAVGVDRICAPRSDGSSICDLRPVAHLLLRGGGELHGPLELGTSQLRYDRSVAAHGNPGPSESWPAIPGGSVVAPDLTSTAPSARLPGPGDPIDDRIDAFLGRSGFRVPAGGRSLVAPALVIPCNSGLVAVLRVPGTAAGAIEHFDSAADTDDPIRTASGATEGGDRWVSGQISTAGGYYLDVTAVARDDNRTDVLLSECGD